MTIPVPQPRSYASFSSTKARLHTPPQLLYAFKYSMTTHFLLPCDGCGQPATSEHIARRLQRLEWTTRYRPLHIQSVLLGGISPETLTDFLYSPEGACTGEARQILDAAQISTEGKSRESIHLEFQKRGLLLIHVLECPLDPGANVQALLERQLPSVFTRIRRSLKPKRVVLFSAELATFAPAFLRPDLGFPIVPATAQPFDLSGLAPLAVSEEFRAALS